jgi:hypothetical protein
MTATKKGTAHNEPDRNAHKSFRITPACAVAEALAA